MLRTLRDTFWMLSLALILLFAFFLALGAFNPGDMLGVTLAVLALVAAWIVHAFLARRAGGERSEAAIRARERRGF